MADTPSDPTPSTTDAPVPTAATEKADSTLLTATPATTEPAKTEPVKAEPTKVEPTAPVVPEKYELKVDGLDPAAITAMTPIFKELGLTQDSAQKLASKFSEYATQATLAKETEFKNWLTTEKATNANAIKTEWGAQFEPNLGLAKLAYAKFGDAEATRLLDETGLGSHPSFLKMFMAIGKLIQEDSPSPATKTPTGRKANEDVFYGTH